MNTASLGQLLPGAQGLERALADGTVLSIGADAARQKLLIRIECDQIIAREAIFHAQAEAARVSGMPEAAITVCYRLASLDQSAAGLIRDTLAAKYVALASVMNGLSVQAEGAHIALEVPAPWLFRFEELHDEMCAHLSEACGLDVALTIRAPAQPEEELDLAFERLRRQEIERIAEQNAQKPPPRPSGEDKPRRPYAKAKLDRAQPHVDPKNPDGRLLFGKLTARALTPLSAVRLDSGDVAVRGEVFSVAWKQMKNHDKTVLTFEMADSGGALRVVKWLASEAAKELKDVLTVGAYVTALGQIGFSSFDKCMVLTPTAVMLGQKPMRTDTAPHKRVELHLHTKMSASDGFCDVGQTIALAASMGHKAVAITDHGVVQAFPEAAQAAAKLKAAGKGIKVLYGVEAYVEDDLTRRGAVRGHTDAALSDELVVFDLETTGLYPSGCEIIEMAALIVKDGQTQDTFHAYIKPTRSIPYEITKLTGISDMTVAQAAPLEEVLPAFLAFCGDRPLIAHNASFDMSFLQAACAKLGVMRDFCSIDTLDMARALLPHLKRHRLDSVAHEFGLTFNHHRADEDTTVLARIFTRLCELLPKPRPRYVAELNGALDEARQKSGVQTRRRTHHILLFARNRAGLRSLYELVSASHLMYFYRHPVVPKSLLNRHRENLIVGSACEAGELYGAVLEGRPQDELVRLAGEYDFLEVQPIGNNRFMVDKGIVPDEERLKDINRTIVRLGELTGKPVVATGDVHFLEPEQALFREILMTGMGYEDAERQPPLYYRDTEAMLREFEYLPPERAFEIVVTNTNKIADLCEELRPIPEGVYPPSIENSARELEDMARAHAAALYGDPLPEPVAGRLEKELRAIIDHNFDVMYIIARKLVVNSHEAGYLVGSRGSIGSSFVAFLAEITEVNALPPHYLCTACKTSVWDVPHGCGTGADLPDAVCPNCGAPMKKDGFDISFATFLGFDGDKAPDIDLNFSGEYQARAHRDTIELFGAKNVFRAGTINAIQNKTAFGFVKKHLDHLAERTGGEAAVLEPAELNRRAHGCSGVKRTTGQHPGGLIVLPKGLSIYDFTPVQRPADDADSDIITTHFDYHAVHDNLLKLDLLGHDDPTMIRMLEDLTGVSARDIPLDDPQTMAIFTNIAPLGIEGDDILGTIGTAAVPEFGTRFVRGILTDTEPTTFDELVRICGLSHGTNVWQNNAQELVRKGTATLTGVISVRDDITAYLIGCGLAAKTAFTISESVRKGKGLKPEWEADMRAHGVPGWYMDSCRKIEYLFPRAHSAAYVLMAYRIAWFKVHRPIAFYSAYFTIRAPGFDAAQMISGDAQVCAKYRQLLAQEKRTALEDDMMTTLEVCHEFYRRGFAFAPVDVYRSSLRTFEIDGHTLVPPLTSLMGVGEAAAQSILQAREKGAFLSVEDMILRCDKVSKAVAESLDSVGALGGIPKTNQLNLFDMSL